MGSNIDNKPISKSVQLSRGTHQKVRVFAALNEESISSVIDKAINNYINSKSKK